jgi:hypothetical protein
VLVPLFTGAGAATGAGKGLAGDTCRCGCSLGDFWSW